MSAFDSVPYFVCSDTQFHAEEIAKSVTVSYKNVGEAVYSVEEAVEKNMIYEGGDHFEQGDADSALEKAKVKVKPGALQL